MNANFLAVDEYMRTKIIMDDVHLNKCPKEIIQWLDDGTVPNVIHYDAHATLSLHKKDSNALLGMLKEITRLYEGN